MLRFCWFQYCWELYSSDDVNACWASVAPLSITWALTAIDVAAGMIDAFCNTLRLLENSAVASAFGGKYPLIRLVAFMPVATGACSVWLNPR